MTEIDFWPNTGLSLVEIEICQEMALGGQKWKNQTHIRYSNSSKWRGWLKWKFQFWPLTPPPPHIRLLVHLHLHFSGLLYFLGRLYFFRSSSFLGRLYYWSHFHFGGCLSFWGPLFLYFLGCVHFWGCLYFVNFRAPYSSQIWLYCISYQLVTTSVYL